MKISCASLIGMLFLSFSVSCEIYKCVDDQGTIHYQDEKCEANDESSVMELKKGPKIEDYSSTSQNNRSRNYNSYYNDSKQLKKNKKQQKQLAEDLEKWNKVCRKLKKEFKSEERRVIRRCIQDKEKYCYKSAEGIEASNLARDRRHFNDSNLHLPKLFKIKKLLRELECPM